MGATQAAAARLVFRRHPTRLSLLYRSNGDAYADTVRRERASVSRIAVVIAVARPKRIERASVPPEIRRAEVPDSGVVMPQVLAAWSGPAKVDSV